MHAMIASEREKGEVNLGGRGKACTLTWLLAINSSLESMPSPSLSSTDISCVTRRAGVCMRWKGVVINYF